MKRLILVSAFVALASTCPAQTTTDCYTRGANTSCQTTAPPPPVAPMQSPDFSLLERQPDYAGSYQRGYQFGREMARQRLEKKVGQLVAAGQCDDAVNVALNAGDMELARRAADFCKADH